MDISLYHLDIQSRKVAIAILRSDMKEAMIEMARRRDRRAYDSKVALDTYLADLEAETILAEDRTMAQSMVQAVHQDESIIAAYEAQEKQAQRDRQAALHLDKRGRLPSQYPKNDADIDIDDDLRAKLEVQYNLAPGGFDGGDSHSAELSIRPKKLRECLICTETFQFHDLARLPCAHECCRGCLKHLFTSTLTDETMFPARCCRQNIPVTETQIQIFLGGELVGKYRARTLEMETPNRTYCHKPACSTFILPQLIRNDIATCMKCLAKTCSICKAAAHDGSDCPEDESAQQLLELARKEGWKQCHACNKVVELKEGCNHMTCRCGAQFCYICGADWKDKGEPGACSCELFDEETLRRQAAREAAHDPVFHQQPQARQRQMVQQRRERIVRNHHCEHQRFHRRVGNFACQECNHVLTQFILECSDCNLHLCLRCKRHRLR